MAHLVEKLKLHKAPQFFLDYLDTTGLAGLYNKNDPALLYDQIVLKYFRKLYNEGNFYKLPRLISNYLLSYPLVMKIIRGDMGARPEDFIIKTAREHWTRSEEPLSLPLETYSVSAPRYPLLPLVSRTPSPPAIDVSAPRYLTNPGFPVSRNSSPVSAPRYLTNPGFPSYSSDKKICQCIVQSTGLPCKNPIKPPSRKYCGVHKNCKQPKN